MIWLFILERKLFMAWTKLRFGKHKGKSLPQVLFADPDWFFWAIDESVFRGKIEKEAQEIYRKSRSIRIPQKRNEKLVAEYAIHPPTKKFGNMEIVPASRPHHEGSTSTYRSKVIDLGIPRKIAAYDKFGCKLLISNVKYYLFGNSSLRMTEKKCEDFFDNDENFDL